MNHGLPEKAVSAIQSVLVAYPQVEKAVLYGSRAKGTYKRGSDIDLTLIGTSLDDRLLSRIDWELDDLLLPYKIDLSLFSNLRNSALVEHIQRVGVMLYEKQDAPTVSA